MTFQTHNILDSLWGFFVVFLFELRSHSIAKADLEFMMEPRLPKAHCNPSASVSQVLELHAQTITPCLDTLSINTATTQSCLIKFSNTKQNKVENLNQKGNHCCFFP